VEHCLVHRAPPCACQERERDACQERGHATDARHGVLVDHVTEDIRESAFGPDLVHTLTADPDRERVR
jgi:hypothetical protein